MCTLGELLPDRDESAAGGAQISTFIVPGADNEGAAAEDTGAADDAGAASAVLRAVAGAGAGSCHKRR